MSKLGRQYSGDSSKGFWSKINALPAPHRDVAYSLGVALQNIETDLLHLIEVQIAMANTPEG